MGYTIKFYDDFSKVVENNGVEIPPEPVGEFIFTLADDYLPSAGYLGKTDAELKADSSTWPFDVFRKHRSHPLNKNVPATVTTLKKERFTHKVSFVNYWANNCALAWFDEYDYRNLTGADADYFYQTWANLSKGTEVITNHKGIEDGYYDPVLHFAQTQGLYDSSVNVNVGKTPIGIDSLLMERNVYKPIDLNQRRIGGVTGYLIETLNGDEEAPNIMDVNYRTHRHLFSFANIIMADEQRDANGNLYPYLPSGHLGLDPFWHGWNKGAVTPLPNVSITSAWGNNIVVGGMNLVPSNRIALKADGSINIITYVPNSFNPERDLR